jgi:hypothetical protein
LNRGNLLNLFACSSLRDSLKTFSELYPKPAGDLLDEPEVDNLAPIHFFEKNYPHDRIVSPALLRLRSEYRTHEGGWLVEQLHSIVERLLRVHRKTQAETERLESVRRATREELYRRISRARDYIGSMFAEPVTLVTTRSGSVSVPNHLLRSFRKVFGEPRISS